MNRLWQWAKRFCPAIAMSGAEAHPGSRLCIVNDPNAASATLAWVQALLNDCHREYGGLPSATEAVCEHCRQVS